MADTILITFWTIVAAHTALSCAQNYQFAYLNFDSPTPLPGTVNPVYNPFQLTGITPYNASAALLPLLVGGILGTSQTVGIKPRSGTNVGAYSVFTGDVALGINSHYIRRVDSGKFGVDSFCIGCGAFSGLALSPPPAFPCNVTVSCRRTDTDSSPVVWTGVIATSGLLSATAAYVMSDKMKNCVQLDWTTAVDQTVLGNFLILRGFRIWRVLLQ